MLETLRGRLDGLGAAPPKGLLIAGEDLDRGIHWVRPELIAETTFTGWSGAGRVRHAVFLGLRDDKAPVDVVRDVSDPDAERRAVDAADYSGSAKRRGPVLAVPPRRGVARAAASRTGGSIVTAKAPKARTEMIEGVTLTHPDRALWPGITKRDLAEYWQTVADHALPGLARRPLAIVRCPEGIDGEHFFQKHGHGMMPPGVRDGRPGKLRSWRSTGFRGWWRWRRCRRSNCTSGVRRRPIRCIRINWFSTSIPARACGGGHRCCALEMRDKLEAIGLASFCRTSGGKGLHVVVPLVAEQPWEPVRAFCKSFAEALSEISRRSISRMSRLPTVGAVS